MKSLTSFIVVSSYLVGLSSALTEVNRNDSKVQETAVAPTNVASYKGCKSDSNPCWR